MLDPLIEAIETVKKRIEQYRQTLSENETRTRGALINPILKALGWDPADPALVTLEYNIGKLRVDYVLLKADGKPVALLEAKKLGEEPDDHLDQMIGYAIKQGIKYAGIVNGDLWALYEVHQPKPIDENRIIATSIAKDEPHACALELLTLWQLNLASGNVKKVKTPIIVDDKEISQPKDSERTLDPPIEPPLDGNWVSPSDYNLSAGVPIEIRFPDGKEEELSYWYELVTESAKWLWSTKKLTIEKVPGPRRPKTNYIVNKEPKTIRGKNMNKPKQIEPGVWVETHGMKSDRFLKDMIALFDYCEVEPSDVKLKLP